MTTPEKLWAGGPSGRDRERFAALADYEQRAANADAELRQSWGEALDFIEGFSAYLRNRERGPLA